MDWLDNVVGLERWPDEGYNPDTTGLLGFTSEGFPMFVGPDGKDPSSGVAITQGVINYNGSYTYARDLFKQMMQDDDLMTIAARNWGYKR